MSITTKYSFGIVCICLFTATRLYGAAAVPSGLELLYGDRIVQLASGEPLVTVGILQDQKQITIHSEDGLWLDFYIEAQFRRMQVPAGKHVSIRLMSYTAPKIEYMVIPVMNSHSYEEEALLSLMRQYWNNVHLLELGTVFGSDGKTVDTRNQRISAYVPNKMQANQLQAKLSADHDIDTIVTKRLVSFPKGSLQISIDQQIVETASTYIRFNSVTNGSIEVTSNIPAKHLFRLVGEVYVVVDSLGGMTVTNVIPLETMLRGILPSEIFASAPMEALQAQAITARSVILAKLGRRHLTDPFHICAVEHCQMYTGERKHHARTDLAIAHTRGVVLVREGRLVDAVYSSTCGGITEDNEHVWDQAPNKALRGRPDMPESDPWYWKVYHGLKQEDLKEWVTSSPGSYCAPEAGKKRDHYRWKKTYTQQELQQLINQHYDVGTIKELAILQRGRGGRVKRLMIKGTRRTVEILWEWPIRKLLGNLRSGVFTIEKNEHGQQWVFTGAGWGHGVGMCQMGAIGRAKADQDHKTILEHYYNQAELRKLYN